MPRGGKRTKIPETTKKTAVELVVNAGKSISEVSKELGLNYKTLCNWVRQYKEENNLIKKDPAEEELKRLKKQVAQLQLENEILKKAMAFFAKETL